METEKDYSCPICREMMIMPRLYDCGHSVCQECMIKSDNSAQESMTSLFQMPVYKCPLCRNETNGEWHTRPVNHSLIDILSQNEDYKKATEEYKLKNKHDKDEITEIPETLNFSYIVYKKRLQKCNKIYKQILPLLFKAAIAGKPYVTITTNTLEIQTVADLLAKKLFVNNSVYKLQSSFRECQIDFVPSDRSYKCEYENPTYSLNEDENNSEEDAHIGEESEGEEIRTESPSPLSRLAMPRLSTITHHRRLRY